MPEGYLSMSATAVLQAIANGYVYGFDIMDATGLPSGTVYPALRRMEGAGLITSQWEEATVAQRDQRRSIVGHDMPGIRMLGVVVPDSMQVDVFADDAAEIDVDDERRLAIGARHFDL